MRFNEKLVSYAAPFIKELYTWLFSIVLKIYKKELSFQLIASKTFYAYFMKHGLRLKRPGRAKSHDLQKFLESVNQIQFF